MAEQVLRSHAMLGNVSISVLEQETYSESEAARLLRVAPSTLNYWLEGGQRPGKTYLPVIREQAKGGHPPVTWAEFVECTWLRQFRRVDRVPMAELRAFITELREEYGVPYPLAHFQPFANQGQLVIMERAQTEAGLDPEFCAVAKVSGQLVLTGPTQAFVQGLEWRDGAAVAWLPHDPESPVRVRPDVRFGRPAIHGISTEVLWEQVEDGAEIAEVAEDYGLSVSDVRWAVSYEAGVSAAA
jgi:uncharacterized protein (DUF433 family)/transposase